MLEPLALRHSWPVQDKARHFELGALLNCAAIDAAPPAIPGRIEDFHAGCWECDLKDDALLWSGGVYDIFGLPRGVSISRSEALGFYAEHSRAALDQLRAHAIRRQKGFTLDAEIQPASGGRRWMRLIAAPVIDGKRTIALHGVKLIVG